MSIDGGDHEYAPQVATMFCLACGYVLDGLRARACPECGRGFDPEDITTYRYVPEGIVLDDPVHLAQLPIGEAVVLHARLEGSGIVSILHEERGGVIGYAEMPKASIWIERADRERAHAIMQSTSEEEGPGPWSCPGCGEHIEGQFAMCWNCGAERARRH